MASITPCGYRCDLCKAYTPNVEKNDQCAQLSAVWKKYYDVDMPADQIVCDGCRCDHPDAKRIDTGCPVRTCVLEKKLNHCGECTEYPCAIAGQREGLSLESAKAALSNRFDPGEYNEFLRAYDNRTRLQAYIDLRRSK